MVWMDLGRESPGTPVAGFESAAEASLARSLSRRGDSGGAFIADGRRDEPCVAVWPRVWTCGGRDVLSRFSAFFLFSLCSSGRTRQMLLNVAC